MEMTTYDAWLAENTRERERRIANYPDLVQGHIEDQQERDQERRDLLAVFPYSVVAEGFYSEHDYATRWCWQHISPKNGLCDSYQSDYLALSSVLETEFLEHTFYRGNEWFHKRYWEPAEHAHQGEWAYLWFGKTDYDYGFGEYYFAQDTDRAKFVEAFPAFTWDEAWNREMSWQGEEKP